MRHKKFWQKREMMNIPKLSLKILIVFSFQLFLLATFSCSKLPDSQPNIILISLDTLRKDALGVYLNKSISSSPILDNFAKDSVIFEQAYAPMPFTPASHMTMLTGMLPAIHNVSHPIDESTVNVLPKNIPTLTQILQKKGFSTHGIFSNIWLRNGFGFERGFDSYDQIWGMAPYAKQITSKAVALITKRNKSKEPFFLFLHYYDIHSDFHQNQPPYTAPKKFQIPEYGDATKQFCYPSGPCSTQYLQMVNQKKGDISPNRVNLLRRLYQSGVAYTDESLANIFHTLKENDLYDNSLIIVTSDHGEEFAEHGLFLHEQLYQENSNIPLIVKFPHNKYAGKVVTQLVELADIMPTALNIAGLPMPQIIQGKNLVDSITNKRKGDTDLILIQDKLIKNKYAVLYKKYKLIHDFSSGTSELYNLTEDPTESLNLTKSNPLLGDNLLKKLANRVEENKQLSKIIQTQNIGPKSTTLTDKEKIRLKSLGYL